MDPRDGPLVPANTLDTVAVRFTLSPTRFAERLGDAHGIDLDASMEALLHVIEEELAMACYPAFVHCDIGPIGAGGDRIRVDPPGIVNMQGLEALVDDFLSGAFRHADVWVRRYP